MTSMKLYYTLVYRKMAGPPGVGLGKQQQAEQSHAKTDP